MKKIRQYILFERFLEHIVGTLAAFFVVFVVVRFFVIAPGRVNGPSMEPTFIDQDFFWIKKYDLLFSPVERWDVVQIIEPTSKKRLIKRIIGLPGETIEIRRGQVFINPPGGDGYFLAEPYLAPYTYTNVFAQQGIARFELGEHEYFVLGDNRANSVDSRDYGPVHRSLIVGTISAKTQSK